MSETDQSVHEDPLRPKEKYQISPRCANCPHSKMLHIQTGQCIQCNCRGFEADPGQAAVVNTETKDEVVDPVTIQEVAPEMAERMFPLRLPDEEGDPPPPLYGYSGGVPLTEEKVQKLADEAEKGYPLDKIRQGQYRETVPNQMRGVAEVDAGDRDTTPAVAGVNPASPLPKSEVLLRSPQGDHYKGFAIEPIQYILQNKLPYPEANVVKYVTRWRLKGGVLDLKKARWYLDLLIEEVEGVQ